MIDCSDDAVSPREYVNHDRTDEPAADEEEDEEEIGAKPTRTEFIGN